MPKPVGEIVVAIKGAGEMASAVAWRLYMANIRKIVMLEVSNPLAVRRMVSFCEAVHNGHQVVEGVSAVMAQGLAEIEQAWQKGSIAVVMDPEWKTISEIKPAVIVDAILAKKNLGTTLNDAPLVIGLGPGFTAGEDCHMVIETNRGHHLGRIIIEGQAEANTGIPGRIDGFAAERVLRATRGGVFNAKGSIGDQIKAGDTVGMVGEIPVNAAIDGVIRGLIQSGTRVSRGLKLGDIDPRGDRRYCDTISDKAQAIAGSVLEAVLRIFLKSQDPGDPDRSELEKDAHFIPNPEAESLVDGILQGEMKSVSKAINMIENEMEPAETLFDLLFDRIGKAHRIGITGPPGSGKSTFTNQLIQLYRAAGSTVGVVAVDPSSQFTGGAIFGDRLRMSDVLMDPGVFIRSMGTRGSLGGLARQSASVADILDASGKDIVIFETVGVGQIELDIISAADTIIVITVPDAGDVIQGMKAGLMEIGDLFVVNKADLPGAERMQADLELVLQMGEMKNRWQPKVCLADSRRGAGLQDIFEAIEAHLGYLKDEGVLNAKRMHRLEERVRLLVNDHISKRFWTKERLQALKTDIQESGKRIPPNALAKRLWESPIGS